MGDRTSANGEFLDRYTARLPELLETEGAVEPPGIESPDDAEQPTEPVPTLGPGS